MVSAATDEWARTRDALRVEVDRVTALLRGARHPTAPALGRWDLTEVAVHLCQAWGVVSGLARDDLSELFDLPAQDDGEPGALTDIWELQDLTTLGVEAEPERDLRTVADRIDERAAAFFATLAQASPGDIRPWLVAGTKVRLSTLTCHLLNETMVHGYDIARADGRRWPVDRAHAALVIEEFLFPVVRALDPRALVDQRRAAGVRITYELSVRGGGRHIFAFDDGVLTLEPAESSRRRIDCHISADPAALLLVAWNRQSQWVAITRGQMVAWGRKPWLGPRLRLLMRNP
ncbi:MAG TPA: maleylpyruvate isomerase N-terminal domain-containing protein [Acidimicrobiales bacterium]|nr:maleylpyruvate isomerase N-terminal domain-containing protein [Acidimicrobiales bacterium]